MERLNAVEVPETLAEVCRPEKLALLIYDMQVGILGQISGRERVIEQVSRVR